MQESRYIKEVRLIDDSLFELFFKDKPEYIQEVIWALFKQLGHPLVRIKKVEVQYNLSAIEHRGVRLDALAEDEEGKLINIEVQRAVSDTLIRRSRYNSSLLDSHSLPKGADFSDLMDNYVIFITETDLRGKGLPAYQVERVFLDDNAPFNDGSRIIFVNGQYRGDDPIGRMMNDFFSRSAEEMNNPLLAERMRHFKNTEEGVKMLTGIDDIIRAEAEARGEATGKTKKEQQIVLNMLKKGLSPNLIAEYTEKTVQSIEELRRKFIDEGCLSVRVK